MTLRELYTKSKALIDMGHEPEAIVLVKPRELGDLFEHYEVTNLAPGVSTGTSTRSHRVVLVEFRDPQKCSFYNPNEIPRPH